MKKLNKKEKFKFMVGLIITLVSLSIIAVVVIISIFSSFISKEPKTTESTSVSSTVISSTKESEIEDSDTTYQKSVSDVPTATQITNMKVLLRKQFPDLYQNNYGAYIVNDNKSDLVAKDSAKPFAANTVDEQGRPSVANAFITKETRQYENREDTGNGRTSWTPEGWHQLSDLPGKYQYAYNRGHLLAYSLIGNVKGFDASESNEKNIIAQTSWANQASGKEDTGQNYYETLVRKAVDNGKKVKYQVTPVYNTEKDLVPIATHIQAKSTDRTLEFNVLVPNLQGNITIDYTTGVATENTDN